MFMERLLSQMTEKNSKVSIKTNNQLLRMKTTIKAGIEGTVVAVAAVEGR